MSKKRRSFGGAFKARAPMNRLTDRQQTTLKNMHALRREAILTCMETGNSFSAAQKATQHVFDTVGWHEVLSRLRRARGIACWVAGIVARGTRPFREPSFVTELRRLAKEIATEAHGLGKWVKATYRKHRVTSQAIVPPKSNRATGKKRTIKPSKALGQCRAALKFVAKCRRDAPLVEKRGGAPMTAIEYAKIESELLTLLKWTERLR